MQMTRNEQIKFVRELSRNIVNDAVQHIKSGSVPDTWDGHELRALLADKFSESAAMSAVRRAPRLGRARNYRNTVLVNARISDGGPVTPGFK